MKKRTYLRMLAALLAIFSLCFLFASCAAKGDNYAVEEIAPGDANLGFTADGDKLSVNKPADAERKIIKTYDLSAETVAYDEAIASLNALVAECGGYVERSSSFNQSMGNTAASYRRRATYTIRVPAENAESFVNTVGDMLHVTSNTSKIEDISETYYSIEAKLEELLVERDSLLDILDADETKADYQMWLTVKQRLSEVTQQIAVYQGQINRYDGQVSYSTVNLTVAEVVTYRNTDNFWHRLGNAFRDGWNGFVVGLQNFIVWLAGALPVLSVLAMIPIGTFLIIRTSIRRGIKRRARQAQEALEAQKKAQMNAETERQE